MMIFYISMFLIIYYEKTKIVSRWWRKIIVLSSAQLETLYCLILFDLISVNFYHFFT